MSKNSQNYFQIAPKRQGRKCKLQKKSTKHFFVTFLQVYWNLASHCKSFLISWHEIHLCTSIKNFDTLFTWFKSLQKSSFCDGKNLHGGCCTRYCFKLTAFKVWRKKKRKKMFFSKSAQKNNCIFTYILASLSLSPLSLPPSLSFSLSFNAHTHTHTFVDTCVSLAQLAPLNLCHTRTH